MAGLRTRALSEETDERIALAIARWQAAHRDALADGDTKRAEISGAVLEAFVGEAGRRAAAAIRPGAEPDTRTSRSPGTVRGARSDRDGSEVNLAETTGHNAGPVVPL